MLFFYVLVFFCVLGCLFFLSLYVCLSNVKGSNVMSFITIVNGSLTIKVFETKRLLLVTSFFRFSGNFPQGDTRGRPRTQWRDYACTNLLSWKPKKSQEREGVLVGRGMSRFLRTCCLCDLTMDYQT